MSTEKLCRLCLKETKHILEIFGMIGKELRVEEVVAQHFWFEIKENDDISTRICTDCWNKIETFHEYYCDVKKAQESIVTAILPKVAFIEEKCTEVTQNFITKIEHNVSEYKCEIDFGESFIEDDKVSETDANENQVPIPLSVPNENSPKNLIKGRNSLRLSLKNKNPLIGNPEIIPNNNMKTEFNDAYNSGDSEMNYKFKSKIRRRGRKPMKKEYFEAEKVKQEGAIESYYKMRCDVCQEDLQHFEALFQHYSITHGIRGFILCCDKKFFRRAVIAEHILWHTNPDAFKCSVCNKIYADKRCLNNHMLAHAPPDMKLFKCEHCPKSFVKKFKLEQHRLSHLSPEEKKYLCTECEKPYASDALLRAHKRVVHEKTYAHMCEICAKVFKSRVFFEKHQLEHLGQNLPRVQCKICEAWMKNEHTMRAHMRLHEDAGRIHECDICGKQGPSRNAILKHKRFVHLSERKFKCTLCDKAFKRAITLKEHMTVHTGEVLYACTFCPKTFNSGANMHAHRKKAHPTEWEKERKSKILSMKPEPEPVIY